MPELPREHYITSMLGHPSSRTVLCTRCGSFVVDHPDWIGIHDNHHEQIDELIDWAQATSKLFVTPEPPTEGENPVE